MKIETENYYKILSEIKEFENDTILKPSNELLNASGIIYKLYKEIENYGIKSGKNQKYYDSFNRVFELDEIISNFSKINDHNYQLRMLLKNSMIERDLLIIENDKLKLELQSIKNAYEFE